MKQRVLSGAACVLVLAVILCLYQTPVLEAALCVLSAVAVYELLTADGFLAQKAFLIPAVITAGLIPVASRFDAVGWVIVIFLLMLVALMLLFHASVNFEKVSFLIVATLFVSLSFLCMLMLRNEFVRDGLFYLLIIFGSAWFADTGAFFTGKFFGRHKLSPVISPKKTVEGAVGGLISNILLLDLMALVYQKIRLAGGVSVTVNYLELSILAVIVAVFGMAGDLIASVIKRQIGIKDYGKCIPGHGGIMDRFDSVLFTAPAVYFLTRFLHILG